MIYLLINDITKIGGLSKVALNLYGEFKRSGYEVKIITGNFDIANQEYCKQAKEDIINLGLGSVHSIAHSKIQLLIWYYRYYSALKKRKLKNSTIIGIETVMNFLAVLAFRGHKIIGSEHTAFQRRGITQFIKRMLYPKLFNLVVLTQTDRKLYEDFGLHNVVVIPNFIQNSLKTSLLNNKTILFIGNLESVKGIDFLIKIIKKFDNQEWKFIIVGKGKMQKELEEQLKGYNVEIKGEVLEPEELYLNADIFILTSRKEGFPIVLLEAKNYGLPIVSFDIPTGPKEMIKDGANGFLIPFGDVDVFVKKLQQLSEDRELLKKMGKQSKDSIIKYTPEKVMGKWFQII